VGQEIKPFLVTPQAKNWVDCRAWLEELAESSTKLFKIFKKAKWPRPGALTPNQVGGPWGKQFGTGEGTNKVLHPAFSFLQERDIMGENRRQNLAPSGPQARFEAGKGKPLE